MKNAKDIAEKYSYETKFVKKENCFFARVVEYKSLVLRGKTEQEAIEKVKKEMIETIKELYQSCRTMETIP